MAIKLVSAPAVEPVTLTEAKLHLRIDHTDEDTLIGSLITSARELIEEISGLVLITSTWELRLDSWAKMPLRMPHPPLQSIVSIKWLDELGAEHTVASSVYDIDTVRKPGLLFFKPNQSWPDGTLYPVGGVRIQFIAGYGLAVAVPSKIKAAILLFVGHLYENREQVVVASGLAPVDLPLGVWQLIASERQWSV